MGVSAHGSARFIERFHQKEKGNNIYFIDIQHLYIHETNLDKSICEEHFI